VTRFLKVSTKKIAILASGGGSNARKIIEHFRNSDAASIVLLAANKGDCGALTIANESGINTVVITKENFRDSDTFRNKLIDLEIDLIVLAGFLWLIPSNIVASFNGKIVNIHPALLPKYGGKGMFGMNVHRAVKKAHETTSGMTIHFVNENYDEGNIIFQASVELDLMDTAEDIAAKVLKLEHHHYPVIIEQVILDQVSA
jgi:phosphoribosylglycinamide formyltransferase 1